MCLKYLKKSCLFTCMLFVKYLREKSQRTKISGRKLLITSWALFFVHLFYAYKKYLDESYLLHHEPLFLCIFFKRTKISRRKLLITS